MTRGEGRTLTLSGQEFSELRLDDSDDIQKGRHVIREAHASWDESIGRIIWDEAELEYVGTLELAKER
jgi:hypothetical protein